MHTWLTVIEVAGPGLYLLKGAINPRSLNEMSFYLEKASIRGYSVFLGVGTGPYS